MKPLGLATGTLWCLLITVSTAHAGQAHGKTKEQADTPPNIVFLLTDDQDVKLNSMHVQPKLKKYMLDEGMFFENAFVTHPVCCPSRSSTLTGKYTHNHHTYENNVGRGCNAPSWRESNEAKTMGAYMSKAGYNTGFFGKYLNNYAHPTTGVNVTHIPQGWDTWFGLVGNSRFYDYSVSNNGVLEKHGTDYEKDYFTDVIKRNAVSFIKNATTEDASKPFFMYIATPAPHRPATPAPQYANMFSNETAPRSPSYGFKPDDKHWIISGGTPQMDNTTIKTVDELCLDRWRTLQSVDDLLEEVVMTLQTGGVLDNTYIFYNSDHGYHLGQFNQQGEKRQPYDEDIRVPLIVRGPGVVKGQKTPRIALNIDLAPTFIELAGGEVPDDMDGRSLRPVLENALCADWRDDFLVEYWGEGTPCMGTIHATPPEQVFLHDCHNNTFVNLRTLSESDDSSYILVFPNDDAPMDISAVNYRNTMT
ncbi:N-acetylglucosamine-6-sulfatase-like [Sycon ciliatum]|uniref:N-acetylglucosamine-6-sulfatase-like n=1 Tax=Sycon ciliatum TaxID=27933 RepID=UPI0031F6B04B